MLAEAHVPPPLVAMLGDSTTTSGASAWPT
jgi:hypothetical protein